MSILTFCAKVLTIVCNERSKASDSVHIERYRFDCINVKVLFASAEMSFLQASVNMVLFGLSFISFIAGAIGIFKPSLVRVRNRFRALLLLTAFIPILGIIILVGKFPEYEPNDLELAYQLAGGWALFMFILWFGRKSNIFSNF